MTGFQHLCIGRLAESHTYYQQAQESSKYTPSYTINLAGLYIEQVSVHPPGSVGVSPTEMAAKMAALPGKSGGVNAYTAI